MEGISSKQEQVAPFVEKTYQMVNDPRTDSLIRWGKGNNSFLVLNPSDFSQFLLPFYFKHSNFSSFVRQLNTYGFRKVDPDKWEFAHQSFLRGQNHLLPRITRRAKKTPVAGFYTSSSSRGRSEEKKEGAIEEELEEMLLRQELYRLQQEQRALDEELQVMSERLRATERKPRQMMSFLAKLAEDPELLSGFIVSKKEKFSGSAAAKKRCLVAPPPPAAIACAPPPPPPPPPPPNKININGVFLPSVLVPGIQQTLFQYEDEAKPFAVVPDVSAIHSYEAELCGSNQAPEQSITGPNPASEISLLPEFGMSLTSSEAAVAAATFPFSLLGRGFY